jgi:hypothetical protein
MTSGPQRPDHSDRGCPGVGTVVIATTAGRLAANRDFLPDPACRRAGYGRSRNLESDANPTGPRAVFRTSRARANRDDGEPGGETGNRIGEQPADDGQADRDLLAYLDEAGAAPTEPANR